MASDTSFSEQIYQIEKKMWNVNDIFQDLPLTDIRKINDSLKKDYSVAVLNLRGDLNVGMTMRTAAIYSAQKFFIFGRKKYDARSCVGAKNYIDVKHVSDAGKQNKISLEKFKETMIENNLIPYFIEQGGVPITNFSWSSEYDIIPEDKQICLVFGNEGDGIQDDILDLRHYFGTEILSIPQSGIMRSLNVSVAAGIAIWDLVSKMNWI